MNIMCLWRRALRLEQKVPIGKVIDNRLDIYRAMEGFEHLNGSFQAFDQIKGNILMKRVIAFHYVNNLWLEIRELDVRNQEYQLRCFIKVVSEQKGFACFVLNTWDVDRVNE